jgi:hypothetical protein
VKFKFKNDSSIGSYQSHKQYNQPLFSHSERESMEYEGIARNPVIVIHGFLGSKLIGAETGNHVWGDFKEVDLIRGYSNNLLKELAHPLEYQKPLSKLKDNLISIDMLTKYSIRVLGVNIERDAYHKMITILQSAGYIDESEPMPEGKKFNSLFKFFYDWRRDISENAARLHDFVKSKRKYLQGKYKEIYGVDNFDVQFDIVAHSKGGLITRYFLRYGNQMLPDDYSLPKLTWEGKKYIDKAILVATPNGGYLDALIELVNGLKVINYGPLLPPAIIGTFPSYYQMMPMPETNCFSYKHRKNKYIDIYDYKTWIKLKWGLANPDQLKYLDLLMPGIDSKSKKRDIAIDHLEKCLKRAEQFYKAMSVYDTDDDNMLSSYLFLGNAVPTSRRAEVDRRTGSIEITEMEAGDGKVLVSSALMDSREVDGWEPFLCSPIKRLTVIQIEAAHMGITESSSFADNIIYYLVMSPSKKHENRREYLNKLLANIK